MNSSKVIMIILALLASLLLAFSQNGAIAAGLIIATLLYVLASGFRPGTLSVSGDGEVTAAPDSARFCFAVDELQPTPARAKEAADKKHNSAVDKLLSLGVPKHNIQTQDYSLEKEEDYNKRTKRYKRLGYRARIIVLVRTNKIAEAGELIDAIANEGCELTGPIEFYVENDKPLRDQALAKAIAAAKAKAALISSESGVKLGRIQAINPSISIEFVAPEMELSRMRSLSSLVMDQHVTTKAGIEPGQKKVKATVAMIYELR